MVNLLLSVDISILDAGIFFCLFRLPFAMLCALAVANQQNEYNTYT